jgi:hypothetical protein
VGDRDAWSFGPLKTSQGSGLFNTGQTRTVLIPPSEKFGLFLALPPSMSGPSAIRFAVAGLTVSIAVVANSPTLLAVPSFARQTGLACQACHTVFPELTPFGRLFKLNGYQIDNLPQVQTGTPTQDMTLVLNQIPPLAFMFQVSYTRLVSALPDSAVDGASAQNNQVLFPQQASLFYAGRIAPNFGAFVQMTYDSASGKFHWDNTELRYAKQVGGVTGATYGLTLNNNPTVQDVWNSTPAWQTPFDQRTSAAPVPGAATQIDGVLSGRGVVGVTGYIWLKSSMYGELGVYRSAPQGFTARGLAGPLDSTAGGVISGGAPYWRVAYEHQVDRHAIMIGGYGMNVHLGLPDAAIGGPSDAFNDVAVDGQYQYLGDDHLFSLQTTFIHEHQTRDASFAKELSTNPTNDLRTFRLGGSYYLHRRYGGALGLFATTGTTDPLLYAAAPVFGFGANGPDSHGWLGELDFVPFQNVKLLLQYVAYQKFNGASQNYDGFGAKASDNNTLYALCWVAF